MPVLTVKYHFFLLADHQSYLGCFYDDYNLTVGNDAGRVLPNAKIEKKGPPGGMTIGLCIHYCADSENHEDLNNRYAGVETGFQCWCGADGAKYDRHGQLDDIDCSTTCHGNSHQTCGNDFLIQIYDCKCEKKIY